MKFRDHAALLTRLVLLCILLFLFSALLSTQAGAQSNYGLSCSGTSCSQMDQKAEERMVNAQTICFSGESGFSYSKKDVPSQALTQVYWADIHAAESIAESDFQALSDCSKADLIIRLSLDTLAETVSLTVTEADSGDAVFHEYRAVQDSRNDLIRVAKHFHAAVAAAKEAQLTRALKRQEKQRAEEESRRAEAYQRAHPCENDLTTLRQRIALRSEDPSLLQGLISDIYAHNSKCPEDPVNEAVTQQIQKDAAAAQDKAAKAAEGKAQQERNTERLKKVKEEALFAWTQRIVTEPFLSPVEGWVNTTNLPSKFYLVIPGRGFTSNCHVSLENKKSVLDCLGEEGRNYYVAVRNNSRIYLIKAKQLGNSEYAGTSKDGGKTLCLRKAGCFRVLAEVREAPTQLPATVAIAKPDALNGRYSGKDFSFSYPQNWKIEEKKAKDNTTIAYVAVAPEEAHLGSWVTHGFFVGHSIQYTGFPQTLDGAYDFFAAVQRLRGLAVAPEAKSRLLGDAQSKIGTYTSPSVLASGETGWLLVVKDTAGGYYWVTMFAPTGEEGLNQTFNDVLKTMKFTN